MKYINSTPETNGSLQLKIEDSCHYDYNKTCDNYVYSKKDMRNSITTQVNM